MTDFKIRLDAVLDNSIREYKQSFDKSGGFGAMANNLKAFTPILDKFGKELTDELNAILDESDISRDDLLDYGRELTLKLTGSMLDPFSV